MKKKFSVAGMAALVVIAFLLTSCDPSEKWEKNEIVLIEDFVGSRGDTIFERKESGLYFHSLLEGTGAEILPGDTIAIRYSSWFLSYQLIDSNVGLDFPYPFVVGTNSVISGVDEGVTYMRSGGIAKLITPSRLAYGPAGWYPYISGYTPIIWKIHIVSFTPGPGHGK